jgi:hypothetical protein
MHFGGVYIDYTTVLTQPFDWLLNIHNEAMVQNKWGASPDILLTYSSSHTERETHFDK